MKTWTIYNLLLDSACHLFNQSWQTRYSPEKKIAIARRFPLLHSALCGKPSFYPDGLFSKNRPPPAWYPVWYARMLWEKFELRFCSCITEGLQVSSLWRCRVPYSGWDSSMFSLSIKAINLPFEFEYLWAFSLNSIVFIVQRSLIFYFARLLELKFE